MTNIVEFVSGLRLKTPWYRRLRIFIEQWLPDRDREWCSPKLRSFSDKDMRPIQTAPTDGSLIYVVERAFWDQRGDLDEHDYDRYGETYFLMNHCATAHFDCGCGCWRAPDGRVLDIVGWFTEEAIQAPFANW